MKRYFLFTAIFILITTICVQAQIAPPYLTAVSPTGAQRGKKATFTIDGYNLTGATEVLWNKPGITATIILNAETSREMPRLSKDPTKRYEGDRGTRNRLQIEATIAAEAEPGLYRYRLKTPLGTTNTGVIYVGAFGETIEREMNDALTEPQIIQWPTTVIGEMQRQGDADYFRWHAEAGQQLVFEVVASALGSRLDSVLTLFDGAGRELASNNDAELRRDSLLAYRFTQAGEYVLRLTDYENQGMGRPHEFGYRLNVGALPYVTAAYPLGLAQGTSQTFALRGFNLGATSAKVTAPAVAAWNEPLLHQFALANGTAHNTTRLAVGNGGEIEESPTTKSFAQPQNITTPITTNGKLNDVTGEDYFRFTARQGQTLWLEVGAQRYGSPLDSVLEVYDSKGKLVPRAVLRSVWETSQTLNDRDSSSRGIRILSWNGLNADDYVLVGNELLQVDVLPKGPDEDIFFKSFAGQRLGFLDTTPEAHAVNTPIYKVSLHPPGINLPPNGLPQTTLYFRNDDGGPMYGKDARLTFTAPSDGEYTVRLRDVRGWHGDTFAYRLTVRAPQPDFVLSVDPENPNVTRGTSLPINVTAFRAEGFAGDIEVTLPGLPTGFTATTGIIRQGVNTVTVLLTASADVPATVTFPLRVQGRALIHGQAVTRQANWREKIAVASVVAAPPELMVWTEQPNVTLAPGGTAWVAIRIKRGQEFKGRIPFDVRNLPSGVIVKDVGLSGVLITEDETTQRFELAAEPWARAQTQPVIVIGKIETASPQRAEFPAAPFTLTISAKPPARATPSTPQ